MHVTSAPAPAHPGLNPVLRDKRIEQGRIAEFTEGSLPPGLIGKPPPSYFRTYEQVKARLGELAQKYPNLVTVKDIGDSFQKVNGTADRDILALTITNKNAPGPKPIAMHLGGVHAREIANPELLLRWAEQQLEGYGRDPEATALLNTREIDILPMVNPDGHAEVERGYTGDKTGSPWTGGGLMQRKNMSPPNGTDINRNFDFHWGGPGADASPHGQTYRGPSAASEHETKAAQAYTEQRKPNLFMDWHSYSELVLYPWGDTKQKAPDYEGLKAVAEKFATYNHYSPIQAVQLYPTTGTTDDWAYGKLGIPAWAVETGKTFHQSDKDFQRTFAENAPVLTYAAKIADAPYTRGQGPDTLDLVVDPATRQVRARVTDLNNGKDAIMGAELVLDPATPPGQGIPLKPVDGKFDKPTEEVIGAAADFRTPRKGTRAAAEGSLAFVRALDAKGHWGPLTAQWLSPPAAAGGDTSAPARRRGAGK